MNTYTYMKLALYIHYACGKHFFRYEHFPLRSFLVTCARRERENIYRQIKLLSKIFNARAFPICILIYPFKLFFFFVLSVGV